MVHNLFSRGAHDAPAIPGLVFRPFQSEGDLPSIVNVINASSATDGNSERITVAGLTNSYTYPVNWNPQQDTLLVEVGKTLVGYANTEWCEENDGDCLHNINLFLVEAWRNRGLERAMQRYSEDRAGVIASADPSSARHWYVSKVPETWRARVEMLLALGYTPTRYYYEMQRSLEDDLPEVLMPTGIELRPPLQEHYRLIWEASEACFRDQQDYVASSEERYNAWITAPDLDPSLWLVAWDGDQVAGAAINTAYEGAWGEIDDLFVCRPWRRQGLGRALLAGSLHLFKARGLSTAGLGVNVDNLSGALGLYESVGFHPYQRVTSYRKQILSPGDALRKRLP